MPSPRKASPLPHAEAAPMPCSLRVSDTASWAGWESKGHPSPNAMLLELHCKSTRAELAAA